MVDINAGLDSSPDTSVPEARTSVMMVQAPSFASTLRLHEFPRHTVRFRYILPRQPFAAGQEGFTSRLTTSGCVSCPRFSVTWYSLPGELPLVSSARPRVCRVSRQSSCAACPTPPRRNAVLAEIALLEYFCQRSHGGTSLVLNRAERTGDGFDRETESGRRQTGHGFSAT